MRLKQDDNYVPTVLTTTPFYHILPTKISKACRCMSETTADSCAKGFAYLSEAPKIIQGYFCWGWCCTHFFFLHVEFCISSFSIDEFKYLWNTVFSFLCTFSIQLSNDNQLLKFWRNQTFKVPLIVQVCFCWYRGSVFMESE